MPEFFTGYTNPVQQTSLADMMNLASGVQNYQQAQQLNPLTLQAKQLELQQAQQINPLALQQKQLELQQNQQLLQQRQLEYKKLQETYGPDVARAIAESKRAGTEADVSAATAAPRISLAGSQAEGAKSEADIKRIQSLKEFQSNAANQLLSLATDKNLTTDKITQAMEKTLKDSGAGEDAIKQSLAQIPKNGTPAELQLWVGRNGLQSLEASARIDKLYPAASLTNLGGKVAPLSSGSALAMQPAGQQTGAGVGTSINPQVFANPITGQPQIIGGGTSTNQQGNVQQPSVGQSIVQGGGQQSSGQLSQLPNESPQNFNKRVAETQADYSNALDQYNNPKSQLGHIPTIQNINNNIMTLLKDQSVNTGAIADYLKNKTNYGALNPKEQELTKYLQQRIQNLSPRTDNDAASKQVAYGSFNLSKEALQEIVRTDNQWLTSQDLFAKGVLHNGSNPKNPQNPNYGGVSNFKTQFAPFAANPSLMRYISLVGEKPKVTLDKEDIAAFNKLVGPMSKDERQNLEQQRQQVLKLVNPGGQ